MFLYVLVLALYHGSRWIPRKKRLKFQILNAMFTALVVLPQIYVMSRPKSSRFCQQPLLNNLAASLAFSFMASAFSVLFTVLEPVPQGVWAAFHLFGVVSCVHGACTCILTLTAATCATTTVELYYASLFLTVASILSCGLLAAREGIRMIDRLWSGKRDQ